MTSSRSAAMIQGSGQVAISILARGQTELAPDGVFFRASVTDPNIPEARGRGDYDPSFHDCTYIWDFGDPGAASDKVMNVAAAHNDLNCAYGKEVGHVFTRPGRYSVTCHVHGPDGPVGSDRVEIVVGDPDAAFPEEQTILVDPNSPGEEDEDGIVRIAPTLEAARLALEAREAPGRILIRRGTVLRSDTTFWLSDRILSLHLGAYGQGARPVIEVSPSTEERFLYAGDSFTGDLVIQGLELRGPWDAEAERGQQVTGLDLVNAALWDDAAPNPRSTVIDDCLFSGFGLTLYLPQHSPPGAIPNTHLHNSRISDWASYAIYGGNLGDGAVSITGTALTQHEQAPSGGSAAIGVGNSQGPLRTAQRGRVYCAVSDFFSRCGWSLIGDLPADQPCLRWNTQMAPGASGHFERCAFEGGNSVVTSTYSEAGNPARPLSNFVLEKCLIVGSATSIQLITWEPNGATFRNNILIRPNTLIPYPSTWWDAAFHISSPTSMPMVTPEAPQQIYSNTYVNLMGTSTSAGSTLDFDNDLIDEFEFFSNENNVIYRPNQPRLQGEDPGLTRQELATPGGTWRSRYQGVRYGDRRMITAYATPSRSVFVFSPIAEGHAWNSAVGTVGFDDFFGRLRGEMPDQGAIETD